MPARAAFGEALQAAKAGAKRLSGSLLPRKPAKEKKPNQ